MFDLFSLLGEYLPLLLVLVPLLIVLVVALSRQHRDENWTHRSDAQLPPTWRAPTPPPAPLPKVQAFEAQKPPTAAELLPDAPAQSGEATPPRADFQVTSPFLGDEAIPEAPPAPRLVVASEASATSAPELPRRRRASDLQPGPSAPAEGPVPVLIVDDSAVVRAKLSKLLSSAGYAVTMARHGQEALEQLNQHWFAMMITDLEMPEMDGFELISHATNDIRFEDLPIVAITGHEALQAKVQDAKGLFGIFKKPWNDRELLARVGVLTQLRQRH